MFWATYFKDDVNEVLKYNDWWKMMMMFKLKSNEMILIWAHILGVVLIIDLGKSITNSNPVNYVARLGWRSSPSCFKRGFDTCIHWCWCPLPRQGNG